MLFLKLRLLNPQLADLSKKKNDLVYTLSLTHLTLTLFDLTQQFHCLDLYKKKRCRAKTFEKKTNKQTEKNLKKQTNFDLFFRGLDTFMFATVNFRMFLEEPPSHGLKRKIRFCWKEGRMKIT